MRDFWTRRGNVAEIPHFLRLSGPAAGNPNARILHTLLIGLLAWTLLYAAIFTPFVTPRKVGAAGLLGFQVIAFVTALALLKRNQLRKASAAYLLGIWVTITVAVFLNGGIRSTALSLYLAVPISAAWLLGSRAAALCSGLCIGASFGLDALGIHLPIYFLGVPFGIRALFLEATVIAALPVMVVLRTLNDSLGAARRWIEELHKTQEELGRERDLVKRLMETSPIGIVSVNREGRIAFANSRAEGIFGLRREEVTQRAYNDTLWKISNHDGTCFPDEELPFHQVRKHGGTLHDVRLAIVRPDGKRVLLSINAAPILTSEGQFDGMVAAMEDVTERIRVEDELHVYHEHLEDLVQRRTRELEEARDQAIAASHAKSVFLAYMSHELKTPLHAILGFSSLINDTRGLSAPDHERLRIIRRSGEQLLSLINGLLDMAKIESGNVSLDNEPVDLNDLVSDVVEMMRLQAEEKNIKLFLERSPETPRFVRIDAGKVRQILVNLLSNAIKYTERGHVTLRLQGELTPRPLLRFEVVDTGSGIAPEDRERIFSPFVRLGTTGRGTGLGLAITREYVRLMGGSVAVENERRSGSCFRVILPVQIADCASIPKTEWARDRVIAVAPGQPQYRVLIVEDQEENSLMLHELLVRTGFDVRAENSELAIETYQLWRPHLIWIDWRLPEVHGRHVTRIREMECGREVKIAALTASAFPEDRAAILAAGVDDLVSKPFRPADIFGCMSRHLGVRFASGNVDADEANSDERLTPEDLRVLPQELRGQLRDALISLDKVRIAEVIKRVSRHDERLGRQLRYHAGRLAFTSIFKKLKADEILAKGAV